MTDDTPDDKPESQDAPADDTADALADGAADGAADAGTDTDTDAGADADMDTDTDTHVKATEANRRDQPIETEDLRGNLKSRTVRSGSLVVLARLIDFVAGALSMVILGRVLDPSDFGLLAVVLSVTVVLVFLRDYGLSSSALLAEKSLTHGQASRLFWFGTKMNAAWSVGLAAFAPAMARFFGSEELLGITLVMAGFVLVSGVAVIPRGILRRQMRFGTLMKINVFASLLGIGLAVAGALAGLGYWALLLQQFAVMVVQGVLTFAAAGWMPMSPSTSSPREDETVTRIKRDGWAFTKSQTFDQLANSLDQMLIAKLAGPTATGLYNRAAKWSVMPVRQVYSPLQSVVISGASRLKDEHEKYRNFMRQGMAVTFTVVLPGVALLMAAAEDFVLLLMGPKWGDAVPIFQILLAGAFVASPTHMSRWVLLADGRADRYWHFTKVAVPVTLVGIAAGATFGGVGVATGIAAAKALLLVPSVWYCTRHSAVRMSDFVAAGWRPAVAAMGAAIATYAIREVWTADWYLATRVATELGGFALLYVAVMAVLPGGYAELKTTVGLLKSMKK